MLYHRWIFRVAFTLMSDMACVRLHTHTHMQIAPHSYIEMSTFLQGLPSVIRMRLPQNGSNYLPKTKKSPMTLI